MVQSLERRVQDLQGLRFQGFRFHGVQGSEFIQFMRSRLGFTGFRV